MLTLKKQVIEEIRNELDLVGNNKRPQIGSSNYMDPFSRIENQHQESVKIKGRRVENEDSDSELLRIQNEKEAVRRSLNNPELVRRSIQSVSQR